MEDTVRTIHIDKVGFMVSPKFKIFYEYFYLDILDLGKLQFGRNLSFLPVV